MATGGGEFSLWLNSKLLALNTDESVFGSYINGILDGDESNDEKTEALEAILLDIVENDISSVVKEIIDKWESCQPNKNDGPPVQIEDVDTRLAKLMESQKLATTTQRQYTAEELRIREAILSQYSEMSDEEENENEPVEISSTNLVKNTNASDVQQANKERREQAKIDSQKKKDKDKEDREKQKQQKEEKKEKRKTVKGEKRR